MIKLLLGGSPCTHWSIAKQGRETKAEGVGWELFKNYLIAREKFKPDYFLYENNHSISKPIKEQISTELGVPLQMIDSALVSAQSRKRIYAHNFGDVPQPEDRGIVLTDILESGMGTPTTQNEKSYCLSAGYYEADAEPVIFNTPHGFNDGGIKYEKAPTLTSAGSWQQNNFIVEPVHYREKACTLRASAGTKQGNCGLVKHITSGGQFGYMGVPVRIGTIENNAKSSEHDSRQYRVYSPQGKAVTLCGEGGGVGEKTGLYAVPKSSDKQTPVYNVSNGMIEIKGRQFSIKLPDGLYIIRKLTVVECCRLQTLPDDYCRAVSRTQGYHGLGNAWTAAVIIHLLSHALKDVARNEKLVVLSMYDGIGTGRYCLDKLGFRDIKYYAYEIDKYAIQVALSNYPDIIQCGDAFAAREEEWEVRHEH
jgi:DNA (cytosine-5)-methyltransferase 3A